VKASKRVAALLSRAGGRWPRELCEVRSAQRRPNVGGSWQYQQECDVDNVATAYSQAAVACELDR
jgi:hypothetical protein